MNFKSAHAPCLFDDYMIGGSIKNRSGSKSPLRNPILQQNNQISFAQLSKGSSRPGSVKKGLFRTQIQKSRVKVEANNQKITNPYYQSIGSAQPPVNKSPSKLLSLKNYGSLKRPQSKHKADIGFGMKQNYSTGAFPKITLPKNDQTKSGSQQQKFRLSFTSLTKNQNQCSTASGTSNQSLKENKPSIINIQQSNKLSYHIGKETKLSNQSLRQSLTPSLIAKQSQSKQLSKCPTQASNFFDQNDQVNISVSDSVATLNLDMNPYLI